MRNILNIISQAALTVLAGAGDAVAQLRAYAGGGGSSPSVYSGDYRGQKFSPSRRTGVKADQPAPGFPVRYASERSTHRFAGATRVVLDNFDPMDRGAKSALLQLDNNDVNFSTFGEPRITTVFYQPFPVKLTRFNGADTDGRDRCIYAVEVPNEYAAAFGDNSLRLVAPVGARSQPRGVRLMLINLQGQVTDTLDLRPVGNGSDVLPFSVSNQRLPVRP